MYSKGTCKKVLENLGLSSSPLKDVFYTLKVNGVLKCKVDDAVIRMREGGLYIFLGFNFS